MNEKQRFDHIPIPEQLPDVMKQAQHRASQKRRQYRRRIRYTVLVVFCAIGLFITANVPFLAQQLSPIPVLGNLINKLEFRKE